MGIKHATSKPHEEILTAAEWNAEHEAILVADIDSNEFNAANKLVKLDADAKTPLAQIPVILTGKDADTIDGIEGAEIFKKDGSVAMDGCLITDNVKHHTTYNGVVIDEALRIKKGDGTDEAIIYTMWDDSYITITGGQSIAGQLILCGPASGFPGSILARVSNAAQTNYQYAFKILGASNTPKIEVEYGMKTDLIEEKTSNNGVTIDGCLIKDGYLHIPKHTPSSASDTGIAGQICYDANYIYVCIAANTWKRVGISSW